MLLCVPACATTVAIIWTPTEIFVAADSAVEGKPALKFCKIRQVENVLFAVEGVPEVDAITDGKADPSKSFDVMPLAKRAATREGSVAKKALGFERDTKPLFQKLAIQQKHDAPEWYESHLHQKGALQVVFFGIDADKRPAYAAVSFGIEDASPGGIPTITVERFLCPGKDCPSLLILGEGQKAFELSKQQTFPDYVTEVRSLVEAEVQDRPKMVKRPIDVLRLSIFGPIWVAVKPQCIQGQRK